MSSMDYFIGIDIGTTSTKAVAFLATGKVLAKQACSYPMLHPQENWHEQNPETILEAVVSSLVALSIQLPQHKPVLISFSAAMHSLILMDKNDLPLTNCIIWADNRAAELATTLRATAKGKKIYHATGVPIHAMSPLCKMLWFKKNEPALFSSAAKFIGIKEFVFQRLFAKYIVDTGIASATGLLNSVELRWEKMSLTLLGIKEQQLSAIVSSKQIEYLPAVNDNEFTKRLHAFKATAFITGSSDGALANVGTGATAKDSMAITIGTSSAARITTTQPATDTDMRTFCYHISGGQYVIGGASNNGAIVIQWLKENLLQDKRPYAQFINLACSIAPGSEGLLLLPYILGERAPLWNSAARGIYFGLDIKHTMNHMVRAAMESVIYNVYSIGKILMEKANLTTIYVSGGFTESSLWIQMLADIFNLPVKVSMAEESAALGAVMVGIEALQLPSSIDVEIGKTFFPDQINLLIYQQQCAKMERLYALVKYEF
jgi:gluconokinase